MANIHGEPSRTALALALVAITCTPAPATPVAVERDGGMAAAAIVKCHDRRACGQ